MENLSQKPYTHKTSLLYILSSRENEKENRWRKIKTKPKTRKVHELNENRT